jgi:hypothetical protein
VTDPAVVVVGGTLAALVTADALATAGRSVLLLAPTKGVGGGFMPVHRGGRRLERGIRVLELHYEGVGAPPPLADYRPGDHGHRPWTATVRDWVEELVGGKALVEVDAPRMAVNGRVGPEVLLSTDLTPIRGLLGEEELGRIADEAGDAARRLGDAGILGGPEEELWRESLETASRTHHGATLHDRLIGPFCAKVRPEGASDVLVALRRRLWVPLFWPRTVQEVASGQDPAFRPQRPFHTIAPGGTGEIVHRLLDRLQAAPSVRIERYEALDAVAPAPGGAVRLALRGGGERVDHRPVLALAPGELFGAAGVAYEPARVPSSLAWVEVADADVLALPGFVHVVEPSLDAFRITPGDRDAAGGGRTLCVELRHDVRAAERPEAVREALERTGIVREGAQLTPLASFAGPTFTAPTADSVRRFEVARAAFAELGIDATVIGGANAFGADTLNEQVMQGLATASALA